MQLIISIFFVIFCFPISMKILNELIIDKSQIIPSHYSSNLTKYRSLIAFKPSDTQQLYSTHKNIVQRNNCLKFKDTFRKFIFIVDKQGKKEVTKGDILRNRIDVETILSTSKWLFSI